MINEEKQNVVAKQYIHAVAISFAGEDRFHAEALADALQKRGVNVFYDKYEQVDLWGENLYDHLADVYQHQALYCIMFLSKHYATNVWTNHERQAAQARALFSNKAYILPIRLDDTEIPGILHTIGYVRWPPETAASTSDLIVKKLAKKLQGGSH